MGELFLFFLIGLTTAFLGWSMVVIASRIERERQERYAAKYYGYGKKGLPVPLPKPSDLKTPSPLPVSGPQQQPPPRSP